MGDRRAFDVVSGDQHDVEPCDTLWGGFPCTDVSRLCAASISLAHRSCTEQGTVRTGGCFQGILSYAKRHIGSSLMLGLENVESLAFPLRTKGGKVIGPDNLAVCVHFLKEHCNI
jgi:hypothetical protein